MPIHVRVPAGNFEPAYVDVPAIFLHQLKASFLEERHPFPLEAIDVLNLVLEEISPRSLRKGQIEFL